MNILIYSTKSSYTTDKVGGAETSLRLIAEQLATRGHSVIYVSHTHAVAVNETVANGVRVVLLPRRRNVVLRKLFDFCQLKHHIDLAQVDIVHVYYQLRPMQFFLKNRRNYGYAVVVRMAGLYWLESSGKSRRKLIQYRNAFSQVDGINYISRGIQQLCKNAAAEKKISWQGRYDFVLDIGVPAIDAAYKWMPPSRKKFHAVTATRFSSVQKRQDVLVRAVAELRDTQRIYPDTFHLTLVGDGERRAEIESCIQQLELGEYCTVTAFLPQKQLWEKLQKADILCHPCEYEGLSKIIIECMMLGLPVCASNVVPLSDYIVDGHNGYLAENEPLAWAAVLHHIMGHQMELPEVSRKAREFARREYTPHIQAGEYEIHFRTIIAGTSAGGKT